MHTAALLAQEVTDLRAANEKKRQKRARTNRLVLYEQGVTVGEGLSLPAQPEQPVECVEQHQPALVDSPILPPPPAKRAPRRCSGCNNTGHSITRCPNR
jgi:hypothetical protein